MKRFLINYADGYFLKSQQLNTRTGLAVGGFDIAVAYRRKDLDPDFFARNRTVLNQRKGAGYFLWKPYIVLKTLREMMHAGDVLFYCDSGAHFIRSASPVIDLCLSRPAEPILLFTLEPFHTNRIWTKRDCFHYMNLDGPPYTDLPQILASFIVCQKNGYSEDFFSEWLRYAEDERLLTDIPNQCGLPNYPDFREHRYDQSILSLLARKQQIATAPDISQWGNDRRPLLPQIIEHSRNRA